MSRRRHRPPAPLLFGLALAACASFPRPDDHGRDVEACRNPSTASGVVVRGHAFAFGPGGRDGRLPGAVVRSLEHPERCAVTADDGAFAIGGFLPGDRATLTLDHLGFARIQTGSYAVPETGIQRLTFQAPAWEVFHIMAMSSLIRPRADRCQIATTVTQVGVSIYDAAPSHGVAGATVTLDPRPDDSVGPVYFQYIGPNVILPDPHLDATTRDGGVLFLNVPPGEYVLRAHKDGARFTELTMVCRAGVLTNASPPWGLQALP